MPEYIKTKGGYFYKITNGKKKRISLDEYKKRNKIRGGAGGGGEGSEGDKGRTSTHVYNPHTFNKVYYNKNQHFTFPTESNLNNFLQKNYILNITVLADEINQLYNNKISLTKSAKINLLKHYNDRVKNNSQSIPLILYNLRYNENNGYHIAICLYLSLINSISIFEQILQIIFDKGKDKPNIIVNIKKSIDFMIKTYIKDDIKKAKFMAVLNRIIVTNGSGAEGGGGGGGGGGRNSNIKV